MLSIDAARAQILDAFRSLPPVRLPLAESLGLVLAEDVHAGHPLPPFDNSAMDGFALRAADVATARTDHPVRLRVVGVAAAGVAAQSEVVPGTAIRIMTGAPIPAGADAVIQFEETSDGLAEGQIRECADGEVAVYRAVAVGANIRPSGEDVTDGQLVLQRGRRIRPAEIAMLAALGQSHVMVIRRPRISILATGDEVIQPGGMLGPGQIHDCNSALVSALVQRCGGVTAVLGIANDTVESLTGHLRLLGEVDLIITTGGVSVGDYDVVKQVLQSEGSVDLWQIRIKPGKPLAFGTIGRIPLIGLPGNPVAAAVAFEQFVRPVIQTMMGHGYQPIPTVQARLQDRIENRGGRRNFVRVCVTHTADGYVACLAGPQGSAILSALVAANGLLIIPEDCANAEPGALFDVQMVDWVQ